MRNKYAYNAPYEKGKNEPYDRSRGQAQRGATSQEGRIKFIRLYHDSAREGAG